MTVSLPVENTRMNRKLHNKLPCTEHERKRIVEKTWFSGYSRVRIFVNNRNKRSHNFIVFSLI